MGRVPDLACLRNALPTLGIAHANYFAIVVSYALRGFGYPLFAYAFLVWITAVTPERYMGTAVGWFWSARTGGLPRWERSRQLLRSLGRRIQDALDLRRHGGCGRADRPARSAREARNGAFSQRPATIQSGCFFQRLRRMETSQGGPRRIVATITTTSEFGFLVFLPIFFTRVVGFTLQQWLQILSIMFATNVVANLIWGWVGDRIGWRRTITFIGACGCAVTTLGLYYVPHAFGANYALAVAAGMAYGTALAGFVPIGAIMATLAPESRGAAMSIMNLGSGMSTFIGPAIAGVFLPLLGVSGVIWIFAFMYLVAAAVSYMLGFPG